MTPAKLRLFAQNSLVDADSIYAGIKSRRKTRTPVDLVVTYLRESSMLLDAYANAANRYAKDFPEFSKDINNVGIFCKNAARVIRERAKTIEIVPTNFVTGLDVILTQVQGQMELIHKTCLGIIADLKNKTKV